MDSPSASTIDQARTGPPLSAVRSMSTRYSFGSGRLAPSRPPMSVTSRSSSARIAGADWSLSSCRNLGGPSGGVTTAATARCCSGVSSAQCPSTQRSGPLPDTANPSGSGLPAGAATPGTAPNRYENAASAVSAVGVPPSAPASIRCQTVG
jgi:hypothetical protein